MFKNDSFIKDGKKCIVIQEDQEEDKFIILMDFDENDYKLSITLNNFAEFIITYSMILRLKIKEKLSGYYFRKDVKEMMINLKKLLEMLVDNEIVVKLPNFRMIKEDLLKEEGITVEMILNSSKASLILKYISILEREGLLPVDKRYIKYDLTNLSRIFDRKINDKLIYRYIDLLTLSRTCNRRILSDPRISDDVALNDIIKILSNFDSFDAKEILMNLNNIYGL